MKRLSIIIPVYDVEAYLPECLDSIFSQRDALSDIEVILVNDGSPDGSAAILEEYRKRYDNITVITQSNQGLSLARMNGLERAQGEYVWFVDSDDYLTDPDRHTAGISSAELFSRTDGCVFLRGFSMRTSISVPYCL